MSLLLALLSLQFISIRSDDEYNPYILEDTLGSITGPTALTFWNDRGLALYASSDGSQSVSFSWFTPDSSGAILPNYFQIYENPLYSSFDFGVSLEYARDHVTENMLFVGAVDQAATLKNAGLVYFYRGEFRVWSVQQMLRAPKGFREDTYFGMAVDIDPENLRTLAVGCQHCNASGYYTGSVITYEPINPRVDKWTQTQILSSDTSYLLGANDVEIYDDLILADYCVTATATCTSPHLKAMLFKKDLNHWHEQQALGFTSPNDYSVSSFAVFEDTIVLGVTEYDINYPAIISNIGAVYVLSPDSPKYMMSPNGAKGKPQPVQWSIHQILFATTQTANGKFGQEVSIDGDTMVVADGQDPAILYIYQREGREGHWSLQQQMETTAAVKSVELYGDAFATSEGTNTMTYYHAYTTWDCVLIELMDHFGDGWDIAQLIVETPNGVQTAIGDIDHFESRCDLPNPLTFRYCPRDEDDRGIYRLSIKDGDRAKHHWEILWRIYEERTAEWLIGNWNSVIEMVWNNDNQFEVKKVEKLLPSNITCERCPVRPTPKPSPHHRYLKGTDDHTHHPTISPAPTLEVTSNTLNWRIMTLETSNHEWFEPQHLGTSYYVSDAHSHRLLHVGTMCPNQGTKLDCWIDLPDGTYVVRVGGDLSRYSTNFDWRYCKAANNIQPQSQIIIEISNEDCQILSYHSRKSYCESVLDFDPAAVVAIEFVILGTSLSENNKFQSVDELVIKDALTHVIPGITTSDIKIVSMANSFQGVVVFAHLIMSRSQSGYDFAEVEGIESIKNLRTYLQAEGAGMLRSGLISGSRANSFTSTTGVLVVSLEIIDSLDLPASGYSLVSGSYDFVDESTSSYLPVDDYAEQEIMIIDSFAFSGYLIFAGMIIFIGLFMWKSPPFILKRSVISEESVTTLQVRDEPSTIDISNEYYSSASDEESSLRKESGRKNRKYSKTLPSKIGKKSRKTEK